VNSGSSAYRRARPQIESGQPPRFRRQLEVLQNAVAQRRITLLCDLSKNDAEHRVAVDFAIDKDRYNLEREESLTEFSRL
jgi:hypothetical protein